jgi:hypothetical protein
MNHRRNLSIACSLLLATVSAVAQNHPLDIGAGYTYTRTNLVPGCACFSLQGGRVDLQLGLTRHFAVIANFDAGTQSGITPDNYKLTQLTYTVGGRYSPFSEKRWSPFGDALIGGAHALGTLSPGNNGIGNSSNAIAFRAGGGLTLRLAPRLRLVPVQADYLLTNFSNGAANRQNDLQLSAGLLFRLKK